MNVCIGEGLTTNEAGQLIVDELPMARATITRSTTQVISAAASNVTVSEKILYNADSDVVDVDTSGSQLTIINEGLYLIDMCQGDNPTDNFGITDPVTIGIEIKVNGTSVAADRGPRIAPQSHILHCSRTLLLEVGDIVTGFFNIRRSGAALTTHDLLANTAFFLQVTQQSLEYVNPVG